MNLQQDRIAMLCEVLKLDRIGSEWPAVAQWAAAKDSSHGDFLEKILNVENDARLERQRTALMKLATLPSIKTLEQYDFAFASGAPRAQIQELAALTFIERAENAVFIGPSGVGKSHLAQAIGQAAILQGHKVLYRQTHILLEEVTEATSEGRRKQYMESISSVALLIIDDFGMRKLPQTAAEDLLEIVMRRYERASTLLTSNRPVDDWGKLLADVAAVGAMLDRLLHHGHVLKCGPKSWRTKTAVTD